MITDNYYQATAKTFSAIHITNNTDNIRVTTKKLWPLFSEFLIWNNSKTLGHLPTNNSTHFFGVTNNVDNYRVLLPNKRDFQGSHQAMLTFSENCYQIKKADFWDFISNETIIFRKLLPDTKDVFWRFISNNTDAIGDSILNNRSYFFSVLTPNTTNTTKQNLLFFPFNFSLLSMSQLTG